MSRFSHSPQVPGSRTLAHFQLAKFSYCTTSVSRRGPLTWSHVFGNGDLSGGFEKYTTSIPGKIMFKVLRNDQDKLEELCMTDLLKDFESQAHPMQAGAKRPSFAVVVKVPCLAVKYPLKNGQVRRIQIKFSAQGDFYSVLALLSEINCPFSESDNNSAPSMRRPVSSISGFGSNDRTLYQNDRFSTSSISSLSSDASLPPYIHTTISRTPALSAEPDVERSRYINVSTDRLSSASSTTLRGSSRPLSSGTLNNPSLSPQETTHSKLDSLSASNKLAANETKQSKTFTGFHDASRPIEEEMSPPRTLPFAKKGTKRSRPSSDIAGASTSLTTDTGTSKKQKRTAQLPEPITQDRPLPKEPQTISPQSSMTITHDPTIESSCRFLPMPEVFAEYISSPTTQRILDLEDWICTHLNDDNFLQFCRNVEGTWLRFALGK